MDRNKKTSTLNHVYIRTSNSKKKVKTSYLRGYLCRGHPTEKGKRKKGRKNRLLTPAHMPSRYKPNKPKISTVHRTCEPKGPIHHICPAHQKQTRLISMKNSLK